METIRILEECRSLHAVTHRELDEEWDGGVR